MGALAWVELLDQRGQVRARHRIDTAPAIIGRGYGCDVLLDDPWISPIHLRLYRELDGSLAIEDAGSENGSFATDGSRLTATPLAKGVTLRAGRTQLRVVPGDAPVAPTLAAHAEAPVASRWERGSVGVGLALAAGAAFGWLQLVGDSDVHRAASVLGDALVIVLGLALWAGLWALITRAVTHRGRYLAHLAIGSAATITILAIVYAVGYAEFLAPASPGFGQVVWTLTLVAAAVMLYGHLSLASTLPRRRVLAISVTAIFGLATLLTIVAAGTASDDASDAPRFSSALKPLATPFIPTQDTTRYFAGLDSLRITIDSLASDSL